MPVKSVKERVYYYECSYGKFRLTYFIPIGELEDLVRNGEIKGQVLEDFPDGVDLRVGETDYADFEKSYGYRPQKDPEVVKNIFYSILSNTKNWKKFRGAGTIPAEDLEKRIDDIELMDDEKLSFSDFVKASREIAEPPRPLRLYRFEKADLKRYRMFRKREAKVQKDVDEFLRNVRPKGIDSKKTLQRQRFSKLHWTEGEEIGDVFARIQHRRMRKKREEP